MIKDNIYISGLGLFSNLGADSEVSINALRYPDTKNIVNQINQNSLITKKELLAHPLNSNKSHLTREVNILLHCLEEALNQAELTSASLQKLKVGIVLGTTSGCTVSNSNFAHDFHGHKKYAMKQFEDLKKGNLIFDIASTLGVYGPQLIINNACTSGTDAIGVAKSWLENNKCDLVIAGGVDCILENIYLGFKSMKLISQSNPKPFSRDRDGLSLCEGGAILLLEKGNVRKQAKVKVSGYGTANDAYHPTTPHPEARGLSKATSICLDNAQFKPSEVQIINAHGTGTIHNDLAEGLFILNNFSTAKTFGIKGYTGHTLAAAGAIEAAICSLCLTHQIVPQTLGHNEVDPNINLRPQIETQTKANINNILSTSLGFGGSNSTLLLETVL